MSYSQRAVAEALGTESEAIGTAPRGPERPLGSAKAAGSAQAALLVSSGGSTGRSVT